MKRQQVKQVATACACIAALTAGLYLASPSEPGCACRPPESSQAVSIELMSAVHEYFDIRQQAIVSGDLTILHKRYPELAQGTDLRTGINSEALLVNRSPKTLSETLDLERYEPIHVQPESNNTAKVIVHGQSRHLHPDQVESVSEFHLTLTLHQQNGPWTVVQTDEKTLEEFHAGH